MSDDDRIPRAEWIVAGLCVALWAATVGYFTHLASNGDLTADQQQALEQFTQQPFETLTEPLFTALFSVTFTAGIVVFAVAYHGYTRWRYAHMERLALEHEQFENE